MPSYVELLMSINLPSAGTIRQPSSYLSCYCVNLDPPLSSLAIALTLSLYSNIKKVRKSDLTYIAFFLTDFRRNLKIERKLHRKNIPVEFLKFLDKARFSRIYVGFLNFQRCNCTFTQILYTKRLHTLGFEPLISSIGANVPL